MKQTREYIELKQELNMFLDGSDDISTAMNFWFDIAETLYLRNAVIPDHWEFKPSPSLKEVDLESIFTEIISTYSTETLTHIGNVLERYIRMSRE